MLKDYSDSIFSQNTPLRRGGGKNGFLPRSRRQGSRRAQPPSTCIYPGQDLPSQVKDRTSNFVNRQFRVPLPTTRREHRKHRRRRIRQRSCRRAPKRHWCLVDALSVLVGIADGVCLYVWSTKLCSCVSYPKLWCARSPGLV